MGNYCSECGAFRLFPERHQCAPAFFVWCDRHHGEHDEGDRVHAFDAQSAAEEWADQTDSDGDYVILSGSPAAVRVTAVEGGEQQWFEVTGESCPRYTAHEMEPPA